MQKFRKSYKEKPPRDSSDFAYGEIERKIIPKDSGISWEKKRYAG